MLEIVYQYHEKYPFGLALSSTNTYLEIHQCFQTQVALNKSKQIFQQFKAIKSDTIIKLTSIMKEDKQLHLFYQYFADSLQNHIKSMQNQEELIDIILSLKECISTLIKSHIKIEFEIQNMAVNLDKKLKIFIDPSKLQISTNGKNLLTHYQIQQKKMISKFQQIFYINQPYQEKQQKKKKQQQKTPNFIINGNTLIFLNDIKNASDNLQNKQHSDHGLKNSQELNNSKQSSKKNQPMKKQHKNDIIKNYGTNKKHQSLIEKSQKFNLNQSQNSKKQIYQQIKIQKQVNKNKLSQNSQPTLKTKSRNSNQGSTYQQNQEDTKHFSRQSVEDSNDNRRQSQEGQKNKKKNCVKMTITTRHQIQVQAQDLEKFQKISGDKNNIKTTNFNQLQEKIKQAKQKAENVLNQYVRNRKQDNFDNVD